MKKILIVLLVFLGACHSNPMEKTKAFIIERKMMAGGKLMISYVFNADEKSVSDSEVVSNSEIPQDSVTVEFFASNPEKNQLKY